MIAKSKIMETKISAITIKNITKKITIRALSLTTANNTRIAIRIIATVDGTANETTKATTTTTEGDGRMKINWLLNL